MRLEKSWAERLAEAAERGCFTEDDKAKISDFNTCFIGEHYDKPILVDEMTEEGLLGCEADAVTSDYVATAKEIYEEVQRLYEQPRPTPLSDKQ